MKILQINNTFYPKGGADVVFFNTSELLKKNGHDVFSLSQVDNENLIHEDTNFFIEGIDYRKLSIIQKIRAAGNFFYNKNAAKKIDEIIKIRKPDIIHIHLFFGGITISILEVIKKHNIPVVHTVHDYRLLCPAYTFFDNKARICESCKDGFFLRCAFKKCSLEGKLTHSAILALDAYYRKYVLNPISLIDHFLFVSQFSRNKHLSYQPNLNLKSSVLYNFRPGNFEKALSRGNYILFYGRLSREKGVETLLQSAISLKYNLKIVGTGPLYQELVNIKSDNIEILGYKKGEELWSLIRNSSYVIVPSELYENNPLTIVEAFSFGKPVIGSNLGGISELIKEKRGLLFESQNVESLKHIIMKALTISDEEYLKMSQNAFDFALCNFSEENYYSSLIKTYNSIIHDKKVSK